MNSDSEVSMRPGAALLAIIGGIIITVGSTVALLLSSFGSPYPTYYGTGPDRIALALACGALVLLSSFVVHTRPTEYLTGGTVIVILSIISLIGGGGFYIGAILGMIGGGILLLERSPEYTQKKV
jgi:hypothetical protein